jgi:hypothetical protein
MSAKLKLYDLTLDRVRKVRMDLGAMEDAEQETGHNFLALGLRGINARTLRALVWASCRHEDPSLTPETVRGLIHAGNLSEVIEVMALAYSQAVPEPEAKEEASGNRPLDGTKAKKSKKR